MKRLCTTSNEYLLSITAQKIDKKDMYTTHTHTEFIPLQPVHFQVEVCAEQFRSRHHCRFSGVLSVTPKQTKKQKSSWRLPL